MGIKCLLPTFLASFICFGYADRICDFVGLYNFEDSKCGDHFSGQEEEEKEEELRKGKEATNVINEEAFSFCEREEKEMELV